MVLVSTVPVSIGGIYKGGDRGVLHALDAATGEVRWTFDTVHGDDLWGNPAVNSGGGAWYPPAIDTERGLVYGASPTRRRSRARPSSRTGRAGPGRTCTPTRRWRSTSHTGELRWYHQVHPHDLFDRDLVHTLIARTARRTGRRPSPPARAAWSSASIPTAASCCGRRPSATTRTTTSPSWPGRPWWPPAPTEGSSPRRPPPTASSTSRPSTPRPPSSPTRPPISAPRSAQNDGAVVADRRRRPGRSCGRRRCPATRSAASMVVNDLVFTATVQGMIVALDRASGEIVWRETAPGGINGWMSVAGDMLVVPVGNADPPQLVAYRLP